MDKDLKEIYDLILYHNSISLDYGSQPGKIRESTEILLKHISKSIDRRISTLVSKIDILNAGEKDEYTK